MVTNGLLLGKRNLDSFIEYLDWIHISVHSHRKEIFEKIERRASFDTLVSNIKNIRKNYADLNIHIEFVVNQDAPDEVIQVFRELVTGEMDDEDNLSPVFNNAMKHTLNARLPAGQRQNLDEKLVKTWKNFLCEASK